MQYTLADFSCDHQGSHKLQRSFTDADRIISLPGGTTVNDQDNRKRSFKRLVGWFLVSQYSLTSGVVFIPREKEEEVLDAAENDAEQPSFSRWPIWLITHAEQLRAADYLVMNGASLTE